MPDEIMRDLSHSVSWWLEAVSKRLDSHEGMFIEVCGRVLAIPHEDGVNTDDPVTRAINHPVGHVVQALLNLWFSREPKDADGLPADLEPIFSQLCDARVDQFRHGRVLLASRLIALFRVDRSWTETHLLPLFDWTSSPVEAGAAWEGFLWSPRLHKPLLMALKRQFLETAHHYAELHEHGEQYAALLTYVALDQSDVVTGEELLTAFGALPQEGLEESAQALVQALDAASEQREEYWANRIQPFWQRIWPKSRQLATGCIAGSLALLSIAARGHFPAALTTVQAWLQPLEHADFVIGKLHESGLSEQFPEDALRLLNAIIEDQPWPSQELVQCLASISEAAPPLLQDHRYGRLMEYCRRRGM